MFYYDSGAEITSGKARKVITSSETEIIGRKAMNEREATALLEKYNNEDRVAELKKLLSNTDYVACKIAEGAATVQEYADIVAQRQEWRDEINQLESGEQS